MKILHTSDWHLGTVFNFHKRYAEHRKTLSWMTDLIRTEKISSLILAGDIFDTSLPSNHAQELYYDFLCEASGAGLRNMIIVAGNHDSPSFLDAPKHLLKRMNVIVIGRISSDMKEQIIPLKNPDNEKIEAVVCAVPYLRAGDIREMISGENEAEQTERQRSGIVRHYKALVELAKELYPGIPLIGIGHLFATGGKTSSGNAVGTLSDISISELPGDLDYLALGHLHIPQSVGGKKNYRYSGSLLKMNFSEEDTQKEVLILNTDDLHAEPEHIKIPEFQTFISIRGNMEEIRNKLEQLKENALPCWVKVTNTGAFEPRLKYILDEICADSPVEVIIHQNEMPNPDIQYRKSGSAVQREFTPIHVFSNYLRELNVAEEKRGKLTALFQQMVRSVQETDHNRE